MHAVSTRQLLRSSRAGAAIFCLVMFSAPLGALPQSGASATPKAVPGDAVAHQPLTETLGQLAQLLASLDQLIATLTEAARSHLDNADAAQSFEMRARYEDLYAQVSDRLAELQQQRAQILTLMTDIKAKLGGAPRAQ